MLKTLFSLFSFMVLGSFAFAQEFENAGQYMDYITKANDELSKKYLSYLSAMSHGTKANKVEKKRQEVVTAISDTRFKIAGMPPYKGDRTLRDTSVLYYKILNSVFNEDYGKIVNMEEIAEQSYDAMEAYLLAQEKANEKLGQVAEKQHEIQKKFASSHNVTLVESENATSSKMKIAAAVQNHYHEVYLVFFKCYKQEAYLIDAMNQKKLLSVEQNINSLQSFIEEGDQKLKEMKGYNNDPSLITACKESLDFYKTVNIKSAAITDLLLKEENFTKAKKLFDSKSSAKRTQQDVDEYNKTVNDMNEAVNKFNAVNDQLNRQRSTMLDKWNNAVSRYMDVHVPVQQ